MAKNIDDLWNDPEWLSYVKHIREKVIPKIEGSEIFVSITPMNKGEVDVKFAVERGLAIMFDKKILAVIQPGTEIPEKLTRVVDRFVEFDLNDPSQRERISEGIKDMLEED